MSTHKLAIDWPRSSICSIWPQNNKWTTIFIKLHARMYILSYQFDSLYDCYARTQKIWAWSLYDFFPSEVQLWQIKKKLVSHDSKTTYIATTLFKIFFTTCSERKTEIASPRKIERTSLTLCPYHVSVSGKHS